MYTRFDRKNSIFCDQLKQNQSKVFLQLASGVLYYIFLDIYELGYLIWRNCFENDEMCFFIWLHKFF